MFINKFQASWLNLIHFWRTTNFLISSINLVEIMYVKVFSSVISINKYVVYLFNEPIRRISKDQPQLTFTYSKSTIETLEKDVKHNQS